MADTAATRRKSDMELRRSHATMTRLATLIVVLFACSSPTKPPLAPPPTAGSAAPTSGSVSPGINDRYHNADGRARSVKILEEPERSAYQMPDELMKNLELRPGATVADVAAGTGYMVTRLSAAVGPAGKVYEEDIQPEFLDLVREKVDQNKLTNVEIVLGDERSSKLPAACCDTVMVLDAYHHFEWPKPMMDSIAAAVKPGGRLVIVEFHKRPNDLFTKYKIDYQKHLRLDYDGVLAELDGFGWKHVETRSFLPYQYYAVFTRKS